MDLNEIKVGHRNKALLAPKASQVTLSTLMLVKQSITCLQGMQHCRSSLRKPAKVHAFVCTCTRLKLAYICVMACHGK